MAHDGGTASLVVGIIGNITGVLLYASPMPIFVRIFRRRSTESFSGVPYVFGQLSTMQWTYFGVLRGHPARPLVVLTSIGFLLLLSFNTIYITFASSKWQRNRQLLLLSVAMTFYAGMVTLTTTQIPNLESRANVVGIICATNSIIFCASPLLSLRRVFRTKSVEFMPFYLPLFLFLSGLDWIIFSWLTRDVVIAIPNAVNFVLGGLQISVFGYYKLIRRTKPTDQVAVFAEKSPDLIKDNENQVIKVISVGDNNKIYTATDKDSDNSSNLKRSSPPSSPASSESRNSSNSSSDRSTSSDHNKTVISDSDSTDNHRDRVLITNSADQKLAPNQPNTDNYFDHQQNHDRLINDEPYQSQLTTDGHSNFSDAEHLINSDQQGLHQIPLITINQGNNVVISVHPDAATSNIVINHEELAIQQQPLQQQSIIIQQKQADQDPIDQSNVGISVNYADAETYNSVINQDQLAIQQKQQQDQELQDINLQQLKPFL